uniref:Ig-like domain-containing protein n=1 Tax=Sphaeramia orbicularis TaxID=375764 RepID=A0A672YUS5_9TELE
MTNQHRPGGQEEDSFFKIYISVYICVYLYIFVCVSVTFRQTLPDLHLHGPLQRPQIPGIHEFTAMGILDSRVIDYFDSTTQVKTPRTDWMKENLDQDYWKKGTRSRKDKQQWFKVNLDILKERMNQTDNDIHVLQWRHGCEGEEQPDRSLKYIRGLNMYSYDGDDFLYFDDSHSVWVAPVKAAEQTKRKWDQEQKVHNYPKGYLEIDCMEWLKKYLTGFSNPHVFFHQSKTNVVLTCMATGFYPLEIQIHIQRNGRVLTKDDDVMSTGTRPNGDNTYQRRDSVEILRSDVAKYSCHVIHHPTGVNIIKVWDGKLPEPEPDSPVPVGVIGGVLGVVAVLGLAVLGILYKKGKLGKSTTLSTTQPSPRCLSAHCFWGSVKTRASCRVLVWVWAS